MDIVAGLEVVKREWDAEMRLFEQLNEATTEEEKARLKAEVTAQSRRVHGLLDDLRLQTRARVISRRFP